MSALNEKFAGKVFLFDVDGTLIDSMPIACKVILSLLDEKGISYPEDITQTLVPLGFVGVSKYYEETLGVPMPAEEIFQWFSENLKRLYATEMPLKATALETLQTLKENGARLCVLTGSPHEFVDACLRRTGIAELVEYVWTADDFGMPKSNPQIFEEAAKKLGVTLADLVMVDDNIHVIETAAKVGVGTVGVYEECTASDEAQMRKIADKFVYTLSEIL